MEEYKSVQKFLDKKRKKNEIPIKPVRSVFIAFCNRTLISAILLLTVLCMIKMNPETKDYVYKNVYENNFSFMSFRQMYQKYFGNLFPEEKKDSSLGSQMVFQESFIYQSKESYQNGVRVSVGKGYLMPALESGLVVFMGNKEGYGETLIIQQMNGVDAWYIGLQPVDLKLYDYIEKGSLLGEVKDGVIDLYFQKEGAFVDYKEFIS